MKFRDEALLREALSGPPAPVAPLLARLPEIMREAARRRRAADPAWTALTAARSVLPRLGWATAAAVLLAVAAWRHRPPAPVPPPARASVQWEDQLILSGSMGPTGGDTVARALASDVEPAANGGPQ